MTSLTTKDGKVQDVSDEIIKRTHPPNKFFTREIQTKLIESCQESQHIFIIRLRVLYAKDKLADTDIYNFKVVYQEDKIPEPDEFVKVYQEVNKLSEQ